MSPCSEVPPTASLVVLTLSWCLFKCNIWRLTLPRWPNKMSLTNMSPSTTIIWHPSRDKGASVGAAESSSICQGEWTYRPQYQLWTLNGPWTGSSPSWPQTRSPYRILTWTMSYLLYGSPGVQWRSPNIPPEQKKKKNPRLDTLERRRGIVWLHPHHISPKVPQLSLRELFLACDLSHRGKGGYVSEHLAPSPMWDTILEAHFSLVSSSILSHELHGWEQWAAGRTASGSRMHQRDMNDSNRITDSILEAYLRVTGISCPQISPTSTATPSTSQTHTQKHKYTHFMASSLCMLPIVVKTHFSR